MRRFKVELVETIKAIFYKDMTLREKAELLSLFGGAFIITLLLFDNANHYSMLYPIVTFMVLYLVVLFIICIFLSLYQWLK
ncbi:hypothetical protein D3C72_1337020 [compost metagenome]